MSSPEPMHEAVGDVAQATTWAQHYFGNDTSKKTLVNVILGAARSKKGVSRGILQTLAKEYGFNTGSISPTLVKLAASKRIFRIGKGVYSTKKPTKK